MTDYAFFLGCTIPLRYPHLEAATRAVCDILKIGLKEIEGASCCPEPVAIQSLGIDTWLTLGARNLCLAEKMRLDILTVCSGCYETLKTVHVMLERDPKHKDEVNKILKGIGYEYKGTSKVYHLTELLTEEKMMQKMFLLSEQYSTPLQASLERLIRCSIGLCGSCMIGKFRVCKDCPVFTSFQLRKIKNVFGVYKRDLSGRRIRI